MHLKPLARMAFSTGLALLSGAAHAGSFELDNGLSAQYTVTLGYGLAMRLEDPADELINGPVDPQTGLPSTINFDDGDRNFAKGSLINNRASILAELNLRWGLAGLALRGDAFYDDVYQQRNDNDSPSTVNKTGPHDRFSAQAEKYSGQRARLLDAYLYADWFFGDSTDLNLRLGKQVVAWGESLFFGGVATAQGPSDATKINLPGVEVKSILLPVNQLAFQLGLGQNLSVSAYYRLEYKPTELEPVGSYFSTVDITGPGAEFGYLFGNPLFDANNPTAGISPTVTFSRGPDIEPDDDGQWGVSANYQLTPSTSLGLHYLRYHDVLPAVLINLGFPELAPGVTTEPTPGPVSYQVSYFDDIDLAAVSFSTKLFDANVAGEYIRREGANVLVNTPLGPTSTRADLTQALLSAIFLLPPNPLSQQIDVTTELGYLHVDDVDPVMGSEQLTADKSSFALSTLITLSYPNVFNKWDLAVPLTYAEIINGTPAMAGAMGSLIGEGDRRASIAAQFTYLQNLQLRLSYNAFLGQADLARRPYADRDYLAFSAKYSF